MLKLGDSCPFKGISIIIVTVKKEGDRNYITGARERLMGLVFMIFECEWLVGTDLGEDYSFTPWLYPAVFVGKREYQVIKFTFTEHHISKSTSNSLFGMLEYSRNIFLMPYKALPKGICCLC